MSVFYILIFVILKITKYRSVYGFKFKQGEQKTKIIKTCN